MRKCAYVDSPEGGLAGALALTVAASAAWRTHVGLLRETVARLVHLLAHLRLRGLVLLLARGLLLVLVVVLKRHTAEVDQAG